MSAHSFEKPTTIIARPSDFVELEGVYALIYQKVLQLKHGETYIYHSGFLASDRMVSIQLDTLAKLLTLLAKKKLIGLCQRRVSPMYYEYLAIGHHRE